MQLFELKIFREKNNLTQEDVAVKTGIPKSALIAIEDKKISMTRGIRNKIFEAYDIAASDYKDELPVVENIDEISYDGRTSIWMELYQQTEGQLKECNKERTALLEEIIELKALLAKK